MNKNTNFFIDAGYHFGRFILLLLFLAVYLYFAVFSSYNPSSFGDLSEILTELPFTESDLWEAFIISGFLYFLSYLYPVAILRFSKTTRNETLISSYIIKKGMRRFAIGLVIICLYAIIGYILINWYTDLLYTNFNMDSYEM
jgi:hypothetical protein